MMFETFGMLRRMLCRQCKISFPSRIVFFRKRADLRVHVLFYIVWHSSFDLVHHILNKKANIDQVKVTTSLGELKDFNVDVIELHFSEFTGWKVRSQRKKG